MRTTRPAVVVSNDSANRLNRVQVVPLTSKLGTLYPAEAYVTMKGLRRKAMGGQITTASKERLLRRLGRLEEMSGVAHAVRIQLGLL
jgi:mRNA interferase MazF